MNEVKNATIHSTQLGLAHTDHGILSFNIHLRYGGSGGQGFGGWCLDTNNPEHKPSINKHRLPTTLGSELILGIDSLFSCNWEDLKGKPCRAYGSGWKIIALGSFLEDRWLWMTKGDDYHFVVTKFDDIQD